MKYETILFEAADDGVATITLNRPEKLNSFTRKMGEEFLDVWRVVKETEAIRAVVLRAAGDRAFCTGVDVSEGWARDDVMPFDAIDPGECLGPRSNKVWKPVICAVQGMAAGGAFYWLNEADVILCSEQATFFDPHVTFGMVSAVEPVGMLSKIPFHEAMRMVLMGNDERITAETALRISLVTEITTQENLWPRAHEIAASIAAKPAAAIQGSVRAIWDALDMPRGVAVRNALKYTQIGQSHRDPPRSIAPPRRRPGGGRADATPAALRCRRSARAVLHGPRSAPLATAGRVQGPSFQPGQMRICPG